MEFTVPLYRGVYSWRENRERAFQTFKANREKYMKIVDDDISRALRCRSPRHDCGDNPT